MRPIAPDQFIVNLISLCIFPFAVRPMVMAMLGLDQPRLRAVHRQRRDHCRRSCWGRCGHEHEEHDNRRGLRDGVRARRAAARAQQVPSASSPILQLAALQQAARRRRPAVRAVRAAAGPDRSSRRATSTPNAARRQPLEARRSFSPTCRPLRPFIPDGQPLFCRPKTPTTRRPRIDQRIFDPATQPRRGSGARRSRRIAGARPRRALRRCGRK